MTYIKRPAPPTAPAHQRMGGNSESAYAAATCAVSQAPCRAGGARGGGSTAPLDEARPGGRERPLGWWGCCSAAGGVPRSSFGGSSSARGGGGAEVGGPMGAGACPPLPPHGLRRSLTRRGDDQVALPLPTPAAPLASVAPLLPALPSPALLPPPPDLRLLPASPEVAPSEALELALPKCLSVRVGVGSRRRPDENAVRGQGAPR